MGYFRERYLRLDSWVAWFFVVFVFVVIGWLARSIIGPRISLQKGVKPQPSTAVSTKTEVGIGEGLRAPDLELMTLQGEKIKLSSYQGKVLLLNFWATWCPPCLAEIPSMIRVYDQLKDKGLEILAINLDENGPQVVPRFLENMKIPFPVFIDPEGKTAEEYQVYGVPHNIIIDREGVIRYKTFGGLEWDADKNVALLMKYLGS